MYIPVTGWPGDDGSVLEETVAALVVENGERASESVERLWVMGIGDGVMRSGSRVEIKILVVTSLVNVINAVGVIEI